MKMKFVIGLILLTICTVVVWMFQSNTTVVEPVAHRIAKSRAHQQQSRFENNPSHPASPENPSSKAPPSQSAAPDEQARSVKKITPLENPSKRPAAPTGGTAAEGMVGEPLDNPSKRPAAPTGGAAAEGMAGEPLENPSKRTATATGRQQEVIGQSLRKDEATPPVGIRLADDFRLPASILAAAAHAADPAASVIPAPVMAATENSITSFYQSIAGEASLDDGAEPLVEIDPGTGELTRVIVSNATTDRITKQSDELFRSLFGANTYNQYLRQSSIERTLPATDTSLPAD